MIETHVPERRQNPALQPMNASNAVVFRDMTPLISIVGVSEKWRNWDGSLRMPRHLYGLRVVRSVST